MMEQRQDAVQAKEQHPAPQNRQEQPDDKGPEPQPEEMPDETPPIYQPPAGVRVVVATFEVPGAEGVPASELERQLREKMTAAGFRNVTRIEVKNQRGKPCKHHTIAKPNRSLNPSQSKHW
jgi:hemolysin activation/secretion protein